MPQPKLVIFNDTHGFHSEQLVDALHLHGVDVVLTDLADCSIDLTHPQGIVIPHCEEALPAAVMVRGIAPGSLEQITLRMDVLHTLAELGIPVFNPASAIEHTVDKARTSLRLHLSGIKTPLTWACESKSQARLLAQKQFSKQKTLIMKPLFGCQGKGLEKISTLNQFDALAPVGQAFYLQEYIAPRQEGVWQDWRLMVIDGHVCAAMSRRSSHWITNFAQGADCFPATVTPEMERIAIAATHSVQADYAGVDLIQDATGAFSVLEVNSVPAWKGLTNATGIPVAQHLAKALVRRIQRSSSATLDAQR